MDLLALMEKDGFKQFGYYPDSREIDAWVKAIWDMADATQTKVEVLNRNGYSPALGLYQAGAEFTYVKFMPEGMEEYYGYWQPAQSGPAPLLLHIPGYGGEISSHPELVSQGFNVLNVSPLGYVTPDGSNETWKRNGTWPVLPDTVISSGEKGYKLWLVNCILAIKWAMSRPEVISDRMSFFGTSQGGGGALLLGSLFKGRGVRCVAADLPFLTNYPLANGRGGAYAVAMDGLEAVSDKAAGWHSLGFIDTMSHARRLDCPVLLTAGGRDDVCLPETIEALFKILPGTRSFTYLDRMEHRYNREFISMASAWFRIYA